MLEDYRERAAIGDEEEESLPAASAQAEAQPNAGLDDIFGLMGSDPAPAEQ
jgi:hypothetical protein